MAVRVSALIPAYNEADVIGDTVRAALSIPRVVEVVVADDDSTDNTAEAARSAGAHQVISLGRNVGKGGALDAIWRRAAGDIFLLLDADLGRSVTEAEKLLAPVLDGEADMAIAVLSGVGPVAGGDGSARLAPRSKGFGLVVRTARLGIRALTGRWVTAPLAGPRAVRRDVVERAGGFGAKFGVEVALTIDALRMGCRVIEVPVRMVHRASGRNVQGFLHRGGQMVDVLRALGRKALRL